MLILDFSCLTKIYFKNSTHKKENKKPNTVEKNRWDNKSNNLKFKKKTYFLVLYIECVNHKTVLKS